MSIRKTNLLISFIIILNIILIFLWLNQFDNIFIFKNKQTYELGTIEKYSYVGIEIKYENEPVEITIVSPSQKKYKNKYCDVYEIDETHKTMKILVDAKELGTWSAIIEKKLNNKISYKSIITKSPTLYLYNVKLTEINGLPYITFFPSLYDKNQTECEYSITMNSHRKNFALSNGKVTLNEQAYVLIEPSEHAYNGDKYTIRLSVNSIDKKQSKYFDLVILLQDKLSTIEIINEEPNYNSSEEIVEE